jgi:hypothetical protein
MKQLPGSHKCTDITVVEKHSLIVLELKKLKGQEPPMQAVLTEYHDQLNGYVKSHWGVNENKKTAPHVVAGFVVAMYAKGKSYCVEPLAGDLTDLNV